MEIKMIIPDKSYVIKKGKYGAIAGYVRHDIVFWSNGDIEPACQINMTNIECIFKELNTLYSTFEDALLDYNDYITTKHACDIEILWSNRIVEDTLTEGTFVIVHLGEDLWGSLSGKYYLGAVENGYIIPLDAEVDFTIDIKEFKNDLIIPDVEIEIEAAFEMSDTIKSTKVANFIKRILEDINYDEIEIKWKRNNK